MKPYVIITDSASDLNQKMIADFGVDMVYLGAELDGNAVDVKEDAGVKAFYDGMREKKETKTFAANADQFAECFEKHAAAGEDILYIGFSGALSGTYAASNIAKGMVEEKYPDVKIITIDSKCASLGQGLAVFYAAMEKKAGKSLDELAAYVTELCPKIAHRFTVDDLVYLKRGGRISAATALIGTVLAIKPVLHVDDGGRLISLKKARGRKNAVVTLFEDMKATTVNTAEQTVFISHADCLEDAEMLAELIRKDLAPKEIVISGISPVVGAHAGPGTLALFFVASAR